MQNQDYTTSTKGRGTFSTLLSLAALIVAAVLLINWVNGCESSLHRTGSALNGAQQQLNNAQQQYQHAISRAQRSLPAGTPCTIPGGPWAGQQGHISFGQCGP